MTRVRILLLLAILSLVTITWSGLADAAITERPLKIGFLMVGPVNDSGYNWAHNQGRLYLENKLAGRVQTSFAEKVPESSEAERVMEKMIAAGNKVIFMTSYGYLEPGLRVAKRHPDVIFMQAGRPNNDFRNNVGTYMVNFSDLMYAAGIVAGRVTKKNEIGYELGHPIPLLVREVNSFTLGARSVNPKARVHVVFTNSWADAPTEAEAAKSLIDRGADVIVSHFDSSMSALQTAEKNGVFSIGCHADLHKGSKGWLTGQCWDWGPLYVRIVSSVLDNSWKPGDRRYDVNVGYVKLCPFGSAVPKAVQQEATNALDQIRQGKLVIFRGLLKDRDGKQRVAQGERLDDAGLDSMDWFVPGVEGALPTK
jgi:basic membrane lipoprotein Med (substrate-binding protein (PBP1-ABC) superfamily)